MPCTATCSGTVTRDGKNRNWVAHRVQNARLRRTSASSGAPAPERSLGERPVGRSAFGWVLHRQGGGQQQHGRRDAQHQHRVAPSQTRHQERGQRRQHHLARRGADLHHPRHRSAPALEPACDGRERHHVMGAQAQSDEDPEQRDELPGLADHRDETEADSVQQPCRAEHRGRSVPVAQAPAEERQHSHDQNGQGGAARQQRSRPAELVFEDVEEQSDREQQAHDRELRHAGADDHRVSRGPLHSCPTDGVHLTRRPGPRERSTTSFNPRHRPDRF